MQDDRFGKLIEVDASLVAEELNEALGRRDAALREYEFYRKLDICGFSERAQPSILAAHQRSLERYLLAGQEYRRLLEYTAHRPA